VSSLLPNACAKIERATQHFQRLAATRFELPREGRPLPVKLESSVRLADLCVVIGSVQDARRLYEVLVPYARMCVSERALLGYGSAARPLGELSHQPRSWLQKHERCLRLVPERQSSSHPR
jgi:hypothetical protein